MDREGLDMNKSIWTYHQETLGIVWQGVKHNLISYFVILLISLIAMGTIILAPYGFRAILALHEMLLAGEKIDYRKLLSKVEGEKDYFRYLLILLVEAVIVAGGLVFFIVPGVVLFLALAPVNYMMFRGAAPKISVLIPDAIEKMNGKKTRLFLALLVLIGTFSLIYVLLGIVAALLAGISPWLAAPILLILFVLSLGAVMYYHVLFLSFIREVLTVAEQPQPTVIA